MKKIGIALLLVGLLSGCTMKWMYNKLDWFVAWNVRDYVSFTDSQQERFDDNLMVLLQWHRQTQLPQYAQAIKPLEQAVDSGWSESLLFEFTSQLLTSMDQLGEKTASVFLTNLAGLQTEQLAEIQSGFAKSNSKFKKKFIDLEPAQARANQANKLIKQIERFTGYLTDVQLNRVLVWSQSYHLLGSYQLVQREQWQTRFIQVMQQPQADHFEQKVRDLFLISKQIRSPEHQRKLDENRLLLIRLFSDLSYSLDKDQRSKLKASLQDWQADFNALAQSI
jgi:hypothetical protein